MNEIKSLYIHIPFCDHICIYCDFYKMIASLNKQNEYVDYLIKEIDLRKDNLKNIETIYIGGGTPSVLSLDNLNKIFFKLSNIIDLNNIKEFSIECNPKDINIDLINLFKKYNINRISLGIQSFNDDKLKFLNRNHNKDMALSALKLLQNNNFNNINVDIIFGLNNDTIDLIKNDLDLLISYSIPHISVYTLIIEDKTILNHFISFGYKPLEDDKEAEIYAFVSKYLRNNCYKHYEISNFAKNGYESIHNLTYWNYDNYIGVGANATGKIDNIRYTNINNLNKYYDGINNNNLCYKEYINLNEKEKMDEYVIMGLRKIDGMNKNLFKNIFNYDIIDVYRNINLLINQGLLINDKDYIKIKEDKIYIMNSILLKILE